MLSSYYQKCLVKHKVRSNKDMITNAGARI